MKKFITFFVLIFCVQTACAAEADLAFFGVTDEMLHADYWIKRTKGAEKILLSEDEIAAISIKLKNSRGTYCTDILSMPELMPRAAVLAEIKNFTSLPAAKRYTADGNEAGEDFRNAVRQNANIEAVDETVIVRFAAASSNGTLMALPCDDALYEEAGDILFDMNVVSTVKIWEPLAILHESRDGKFFFAVSQYCSGWIKKDDCALCDKKTLREIASRPFCVVTGSRVTCDIRTSAPDIARREFFMGTKLPIAEGHSEIEGVSCAFSRVVLVPERAEDGTLHIVEERLPLSSDVIDGYLPYTRANVIRQAFKMLGERYGWGGSFGSRDCSAFVRDIYLTFGLELPRNSRVQATAPIGRIDTSTLEPGEKERILARSGAGTLVQMPGHIMMYIGTYAKRPFIIHAAYSLGSRDTSIKDIRTVNCVTVSDMQMTRKNGSRIIDNITNINIIR